MAIKGYQRTEFVNVLRALYPEETMERSAEEIVDMYNKGVKRINKKLTEMNHSIKLISVMNPYYYRNM